MTKRTKKKIAYEEEKKKRKTNFGTMILDGAMNEQANHARNFRRYGMRFIFFGVVQR
jgi:hypothetical protein